MSIENNSALIRTLDECNTVLLHGTSIEATIHLLETGVFDYKINNMEAYKYQDYLFFSPNGRYFEGNNLGVRTDICTWKESLKLAELYAKVIVNDHYIQSVSGFRPEYVSEIGDDGWNWAVEKFLFPEFKQHGFDRQYLKNLLKDLDKRKGVILGFNENILKTKIERGKDEPHMEVCIHLPQGISIDYISGIQPIGPIEEEILKNLNTNNLKLNNQNSKSLTARI